MIDSTSVDDLDETYKAGYSDAYPFDSDEATERIRHLSGLAAVAAVAWETGRSSSANPFI